MKKIFLKIVLGIVGFVFLVTLSEGQPSSDETMKYDMYKLSKLKNYSIKLTHQGMIGSEIGGKDELAARYYNDKNFEIVDSGSNQHIGPIEGSGKSDYILAGGHYYKKEDLQSAMLENLPAEARNSGWIDLGTNLDEVEKAPFDPFSGLWQAALVMFINMPGNLTPKGGCIQAGRTGTAYEMNMPIPKKESGVGGGTIRGTLCIDKKTYAPLAIHLVTHSTAVVNGNPVTQHENYDFMVTNVGDIRAISPPSGAKPKPAEETP